MKELICIVCPKGCHLKVDEENDYAVTGYGCKRGIEYGKKELVNPTRVLTSTVKVEGAAVNRCPVKTNGDIPKKEIRNAMKTLNQVIIKAPVKAGDTVLDNIAGTGISWVATKNL